MFLPLKLEVHHTLVLAMHDSITDLVVGGLEVERKYGMYRYYLQHVLDEQRDAHLHLQKAQHHIAKYDVVLNAEFFLGRFGSLHLLNEFVYLQLRGEHQRVFVLGLRYVGVLWCWLYIHRPPEERYQKCCRCWEVVGEKTLLSLGP